MVFTCFGQSGWGFPIDIPPFFVCLFVLRERKRKMLHFCQGDGRDQKDKMDPNLLWLLFCLVSFLEHPHLTLCSKVYLFVLAAVIMCCRNYCEFSKL